MDTLFAIVMTLTVNGEAFQTVPATFYTMDDCKAVIIENKLDTNIFQCEMIKDE